MNTVPERTPAKTLHSSLVVLLLSDSRIGHRAGSAVTAGQRSRELVQLPQPGADGLALAQVLHQEKQA